MSMDKLRSQLLRRKPLAEVEDDTPADERLTNSLGLWQLTAIGVVFSGWLILSLPWETWLRFGVWLVLGLIVYFFSSRTHSKLENLPEPVPHG
ncbi:hypothetical protein FXW78_10860 [Rhodococcus opacus]|nr:hypothetical protein [Rhodococcus opacus]RZK96341.1 MAG: hypothetical protein EOP30_00495 [Rhodococcus sp. (in: high G+C Gram-positive bacteria)]